MSGIFAAYNFEDLDEEAFNAWTESRDREFRQVLRMPQLGLTGRYHQRVSETLDRFNIVQTAMVAT